MNNSEKLQASLLVKEAINWGAVRNYGERMGRGVRRSGDWREFGKGLVSAPANLASALNIGKGIDPVGAAGGLGSYISGAGLTGLATAPFILLNNKILDKKLAESETKPGARSFADIVWRNKI